MPRTGGAHGGFSAAALGEALRGIVPPAATALVVAASGGMDSSCLLAALAQLGPLGRRGLPLRAVHVDHGLQPAAVDFRRVCESLCRRFDVPLSVVAVAVDSSPGTSIEAAARDARYAGLARELAPGECLVTAHHADDQAETLLLQLLRGAGPKGLSAMPVCRAWHGGWHLRPLLEVTRRELRAFGTESGLVDAPDPMNADLRFDRAYLRAQLWPQLEARWPGAALALARSARHMADAQELLDRAAVRALVGVRDDRTLSVSGLRALDLCEQYNALRYWIAEQGAAPPSTARLTEALRQMVSAADDQLPAVAWSTHALRRYQGRLFLTAKRPPRVAEEREWRIEVEPSFDLGGGLGTLRWSPQRGGLDRSRLPGSLRVRRRRGGEALQPAPRAHTVSLQHLCQSLGVLPWMRDALPLLYAGAELIAVGDLWHDARWCVARGAPGVSCVWEGAPAVT
jgi:tRNA(Ile)-lysidine synthase